MVWLHVCFIKIQSLPPRTELTLHLPQKLTSRWIWVVSYQIGNCNPWQHPRVNCTCYDVIFLRQRELQQRTAATFSFHFDYFCVLFCFFYFGGAFCPQHRAWMWQCWKKESSSSSSSVSNISRRSKLESQCASSSPSSPWTKSCVGAHHARPARRSLCLTDVGLGRGGCQTQILTVSYSYSQSNFQNFVWHWRTVRTRLWVS